MLREKWGRVFFRILARIPEPLYSWLKDADNWFSLLRCPELVEHSCESEGGLHPDKTIYVIGDFSYSVGLASWYDNVLGRMKRAQRKGWIPVVARTAPDAGSGEVAERGDWYEYFSPVSDVSPDDVQKCANVVRARPLQMIHKRFNRREIAIRHSMSNCASFNHKTMDFILPRYKSLFGDKGGDFVGIYYRGTDYRKEGDYCPAGHAAVLEYDAFIDYIEHVLAGWHVSAQKGERLFFVTEEDEALKAFLGRFPLANYFQKPRFMRGEIKTKTPMHVPHGTTFKENNRMYLLDLYSLSRCGYLIGPMNSGLLMALNLNGNRYKGVHIMKTGVN